MQFAHLRLGRAERKVNRGAFTGKCEILVFKRVDGVLIATITVEMRPEPRVDRRSPTTQFRRQQREIHFDVSRKFCHVPVLLGRRGPRARR